MNSIETGSDLDTIIHNLQHFLPSQAPLKDFVHHNTLHAFQDLPFHEALKTASQVFGYKVYQPLSAYRKMFAENKIDKNVILHFIEQREYDNVGFWFDRLINAEINENVTPEIGLFREEWKSRYKINMDKNVHPILFRLIGTYLDQGLAIMAFPEPDLGFLDAIKHLNDLSFKSLFKSKRVKALLDSDVDLEVLLNILVGPKEWHERYLFDQQFAHPGWSGMVSFLESNPTSLFDFRPITFRDFMTVETLLEIDFLDVSFGENWKPIGHDSTMKKTRLFGDLHHSTLCELFSIWQDAYEWSYYNHVLKGLQSPPKVEVVNTKPSFQSLFCIDDRTAAFRAHLEKAAPDCATYGTAGFFSAEFYFEPEYGKFYTKVCPAPVTPKYLIKEKESSKRHKKDAHFSKESHGFLAGFLVSQTMGFWSAIKLSASIFWPTESKASVSSFKHMDPYGKLSIEYHEKDQNDGDLQVGFTIDEMANRVEQLLRSIGLIDNFADFVYIIGHGASSTNNTHYAGYDCGACSGRPGSVNARVMAFMANSNKVRKILAERGLNLPDSCQFVGGLQDTTRDEIQLFDTHKLTKDQQDTIQTHLKQFNVALTANAVERAQQFLLISEDQSDKKIHAKVKLRSLSLFEPRPEWNHATNALCVVGRRETQQHFAFERRAFLNSYNYLQDPDGKFLLNILNAVAPVCGGINLEYYFSKNDNSRLGAGSKLPHNVMGLIGVANGMDGDLRTGLPLQMVNIHEAIRLLAIVEHFPEVVMQTIVKNPSTFEWFKNEWVRLAVIHPETLEIYVLVNGEFKPHKISSEDQANASQALNNQDNQLN